MACANAERLGVSQLAGAGFSADRACPDQQNRKRTKRPLSEGYRVSGCLFRTEAVLWDDMNLPEWTGWQRPTHRGAASFCDHHSTQPKRIMVLNLLKDLQSKACASRISPACASATGPPSEDQLAHLPDRSHNDPGKTDDCRSLAYKHDMLYHGWNC